MRAPGDRGGERDEFRKRYLRLKAALHDPVTDLPAYPALISTLRAWLDDRRHVGVIQVGIAELDLVESLYGWQVLDRMLARVADVLRGLVGEVVPEGTILALDRIAGDRFVAFVPVRPDGRAPDGAFLAALCDRIRRRLDESHDGEAFLALGSRVEFRLGHALLSENPYYRFERRVHAAVSEAGAFPDRQDARRDRSAGEELRRIVESREVHARFLRVVDLETSATVGYEALARGPEGSAFERPSSMFAVSGRVGIDTALDRVCRDAAISACGDLDDGPLLFLNALPRSLDDPEWHGDRVAGLLARCRRVPSTVVVEVSERALDGDVERAGEAVSALRRHGYRFGLDDVGTGYASIAAIETLRPEYVKVDPSLVRGIDGRRIQQEALAALVAIASRLGADVVAEGVETEDEASAVRSLGVRYAQGFLFGRPGATP